MVLYLPVLFMRNTDEHQISSNLVEFHQISSHTSAGGLKVQDMALQSLGLLFIARPQLMASLPARQAMTGALAPGSLPSFKTRALKNITELLRVCFHQPWVLILIPLAQVNRIKLNN